MQLAALYGEITGLPCPRGAQAEVAAGGQGGRRCLVAALRTLAAATAAADAGANGHVAQLLGLGGDVLCGAVGGVCINLCAADGAIHSTTGGDSLSLLYFANGKHSPPLLIKPNFFVALPVVANAGSAIAHNIFIHELYNQHDVIR